MSNVKNNSNDPFAALGRLGESIFKEGGRVVEERVKHVTEDIESVSTAIKTGGFLGGAAQFVDVTSLGHQVAHNIDSIIPGEDLPPALKEGISLGVNILGANIPAIAKDGFDLYNAMNAGGGAAPPKDAAGAPAGQRMQTPESPSTALERAKERKSEIKEAKMEAIKEAKEKAKTAAKEKAQNNRITELETRVSYLEELAGVGSGFFDDVDLAPGKPDARLAKLERELAEADAEIDRILNNPNLSFEDLIFLLMRAVIKQSETETKIGLQEERNSRAEERTVRDGVRGELKGMQSAITAEEKHIAGMKAGPEKDNAIAELNGKKAELNSRREDLSTSLQDSSESRAERMEELKQAMQKVTEMQQALSNILNSMHQTAMNAIGNIR